VRLYVPATTADLLPADAPIDAAAGATPSLRRLASAVTPGLRAALPDEDDEGLELSAFLTAADLSVLEIAATGAPPRRVVLAVEADAGTVRDGEVPAGLADLPSIVGVVDLAWRDVVAIHLDDDAPATAALVRRAVDEEAALEELGEVDLQWFDPSELGDLRVLLSDS